MTNSLSQTGWPVSIVLAVLQVRNVMVLELLLQRQGVELAAKRKLSVDLFPAYAKVLDVEEADMLRGVSELLCELLLAARLVELAQVKRDQLGPVD